MPTLKRQLWGRASSLAIIIAAAGLLPALSVSARADNDLRGAFGQHGATAAIVMPNGRMAPDGEFGLGYSEVSPYRRYFLTQQFLPWLQGTYRYAAISYARYGTNVQNQSYKDKSVDVKVRLVKEGPYLPDVSVGFRDVGGTGLFAGEYVAATRRIYDFDFTGGLAWGNIGARGGISNPFGYLSNSFRTSSRGNGGTGTLSTAFFTGEEAAPYGAIEWYPSSFPQLSLKLEYDGNDYKSEPFGANLGAASPFNFGLVYRPFKWVDVAASFERGNAVGLRFVLHTNFNTDVGVPKIADKPPYPVPVWQSEKTASQNNRPVDTAALATAMASSGLELSSADFRGRNAVLRTRTLPDTAGLDKLRGELARNAGIAQFDTIEVASADGSSAKIITGFSERSRGQSEIHNASDAPPSPGTGQLAASRNDREIKKKIFDALDQIGFTGQALAFSGERAYLEFSQPLYSNRDVALVRAARVLAALLPPDLSVIDVSEYASGVPVSRRAFLRRDIARAANYQASEDEAWVTSASLDLPEDGGLSWDKNSRAYPDFTWGLSPKLRQSVGGPSNFYLYQIYGNLTADVNLSRNFSISGGIGHDIHNNFDFSYGDGPSGLPRVRTKIYEYLTGASTWIDSLHADYINNIGDSVFYRASAGIYEWMYSGVGGEILYKKPDARWALGLDANYVRQRDFDGGFGLLDYSTVVGNLTYYHQLPIWGLEAQISVGRYLAQDVGATFSLSRKFDNGVQFGVWATKTNVSAEQFGEGSFDKGFRVTIPFEVFSTSHSKSSADFTFAPLTRDGGQKVIMPKPLYNIVTGG